MSNPPMPTSLGTPFAPHLLVQVLFGVGPVTIGLYTYMVIDPSILLHKQAHAFHINNTALAAHNINIQLQLSSLI